MRLIFDIEANGFLENVTKIHCIVAKDRDSNKVYRFNPDEIKKGLELLKSASVLYAHNGLDYDIRAIKKLYPSWTTKAYIYDTLIAAKVAFPDIKDRDFNKLRHIIRKKAVQRTEIEKLRIANIGRHSLEAYGLRMGKFKGSYGKDNGFETYSTEMLEYCVQDVEVTHELLKRIEKQEVPDKALDMEFEVQKICLAQTEKGFGFDYDLAKELESKLEADKLRLGNIISDELGGHFLIPLAIHVPKRTIKYKDITRGNTYAGAAYTRIKFKEFNPNSRYEVATRLQERLGWKPKEFGKDGKPTLNEEILDKMKYPVAKVISEYLMLDKRLGMLSNGKNAWLKLYNPETRSIHGRVNTLGAATSRSSHHSPNLAQIPAVRAPYGKECRELFVPPKGMKLYDVDLSGVELRMLAHYMYNWDNGAYGDIILNGDIHTANMEAAGIDDRNTMKTIMYARLYGSGMENLSKVSGLPVKVIKQKMHNLDKNLPALKSLTDAVKETIRNRGYVKALDNRKIYCSSEHAALNYLLQSAGAIVAKLWMVYSVDEMKNLGYSLNKEYYQVAFIHDQYDWVYDPELISHSTLESVSLRALERVEKDLSIKVKLGCKGESGDNFSEVH